MYTPAMQRTTGATEAQYLFAPMSSTTSAIAATNGSATTSTRRRSARRSASASPSRDLPPAHGRQGPQSRHGVVLDARSANGRAREAFERWLDPANFDSAGRQKVSLMSLNRGIRNDADRRREARASPNCTRAPAASSCPTHGTSARRSISARSASRRWRPPAPAWLSRPGGPDSGVDARLCAAPHRRARRGDAVAGQRRFRSRIRGDAGRSPRERAGSASEWASRVSRSRITPAIRKRRSTASLESVRRIRAARAAIDATGERVLLTARSETILRGHPDGLQEALRRLAAYAEAGADVLYAPGLKTARFGRRGGARRRRVAGQRPRGRARIHASPARGPRRAQNRTGGLARMAWGASSARRSKSRRKAGLTHSPESRSLARRDRGGLLGGRCSPGPLRDHPLGSDAAERTPSITDRSPGARSVAGKRPSDGGP